MTLLRFTIKFGITLSFLALLSNSSYAALHSSQQYNAVADLMGNLRVNDQFLNQGIFSANGQNINLGVKIVKTISDATNNRAMLHRANPVPTTYEEALSAIHEVLSGNSDEAQMRNHYLFNQEANGGRANEQVVILRPHGNQNQANRHNPAPANNNAAYAGGLTNNQINLLEDMVANVNYVGYDQVSLFAVVANITEQEVQDFLVARNQGRVRPAQAAPAQAIPQRAAQNQGQGEQAAPQAEQAIEHDVQRT